MNACAVFGENGSVEDFDCAWRWRRMTASELCELIEEKRSTEQWGQMGQHVTWEREYVGVTAGPGQGRP